MKAHEKLQELLIRCLELISLSELLLRLSLLCNHSFHVQEWEIALQKLIHDGDVLSIFEVKEHLSNVNLSIVEFAHCLGELKSREEESPANVCI